MANFREFLKKNTIFNEHPVSETFIPLIHIIITITILLAAQIATKELLLGAKRPVQIVCPLGPVGSVGTTTPPRIYEQNTIF